MSDAPLFPRIEGVAAAAAAASARVQLPVRNQVEMQLAALDDLVAEDHQVRVVWAFVVQQDLSVLYARIRAREAGPGHPATAPEILLALWLNATLDGIGSARELARRCTDDVPYRWLCGGVSVNYHTLSDFRVEQTEFLDDLLSRDVAALMAEGLVTLRRVAQDGLRVRASAGASSYRRRPRLEHCLQEARAQVEALRRELEKAPASATPRQRAARERAARERQARLERALARSEALRATKSEQDREKVRVSTTDPEVPVMKMADGGFRPAANVELATDTGSQIITGVTVTARGSDLGEMAPMVEQLRHRYGGYPAEVLVDGGFAKKEDIETVSAPDHGCLVYAPVSKPKDPHRDRFAPLPGDSECIATWRRRMGTPEAQEIYKERASTAECINAIVRNRGLRQFTVRGLKKILTVVLWHVLAHNLMRAHALRSAAA